MSYLADLQEQWALLSLKSSGTHMPDVELLVPKADLANFSTPLTSYAPRTEALHKQAVQQYYSQDAAEHAAGKELLASLSMKPVPFVALWDFFPNVYAAFPPDVLHQDHIGVTHHILNFLDTVLKGAQWKQVNDRLGKMRPLHEAYFPSSGLDAPKMQGVERKSLMKFLAPAVYGIADDHTTQTIAGGVPRWL